MANDAMNNSFLGRGWSFPPSFSRNNGALQADMVMDEEDIRQSLRILLSTAPGERVMQTTYGCGLKGMVFENIDESVITELKDVIERAVLFFEPRITLDKIGIGTQDVYEGIIQIRLDYTIRTINTRSNIVYPFYFNEGTQVSL